MTRLRLDWQDVLLGAFLVAVAAGTLYATRTLSVGHAADMGPGYMPRVVSLALLGFGLFFLGRSARGVAVTIEAVHLRPLFAVLAAAGVFALTAERLGLAIASVLTVMLAGLATRETRPLESMGFALLLSSLAALLFIKVLALPVPLWPR
ncbi:MAG: tripartite tricarboxylate transporter TctB family protein [Bosea sp.]|uniref:tripartite tricarboxylate transporter TctB family protein n=1 Tax=Bosea sp. (in: a-proteobacteria) TaxID=1871050 RepID=UPI002386C038|nr:tripartite tricarboxylate transporter TctB family protein [Bosea sp. (in: a-proteobacteria)]MCP4734026.1 tripartite tricarboxylate transporter TctB family protein [Bosea sp. (in: a-proteobacteria)]